MLQLVYKSNGISISLWIILYIMDNLNFNRLLSSDSQSSWSIRLVTLTVGSRVYVLVTNISNSYNLNSYIIKDKTSYS